MKKVIIASIFIVLISLPFTYATSVSLGSIENVDVATSWVINFNENSQINYIKNAVINSLSEDISTSVLKKSKKSLEIIPVVNYHYNENYTLNIELINGKKYEYDFRTVKSILNNDKILFFKTSEEIKELLGQPVNEKIYSKDIKYEYSYKGEVLRVEVYNDPENNYPIKSYTVDSGTLSEEESSIYKDLLVTPTNGEKLDMSDNSVNLSKIVATLGTPQYYEVYNHTSYKYNYFKLNYSYKGEVLRVEVYNDPENNYPIKSYTVDSGTLSEEESSIYKDLLVTPTNGEKLDMSDNSVNLSKIVATLGTPQYYEVYNHTSYKYNYFKLNYSYKGEVLRVEVYNDPENNYPIKSYTVDSGTLSEEESSIYKDLLVTPTNGEKLDMSDNSVNLSKIVATLGTPQYYEVYNHTSYKYNYFKLNYSYKGEVLRVEVYNDPENNYPIKSYTVDSGTLSEEESSIYKDLLVTPTNGEKLDMSDNSVNLSKIVATLGTPQYYEVYNHTSYKYNYFKLNYSYKGEVLRVEVYNDPENNYPIKSYTVDSATLSEEESSIYKDLLVTPTNGEKLDMSDNSVNLSKIVATLGTPQYYEVYNHTSYKYNYFKLNYSYKGEVLRVEVYNDPENNYPIKSYTVDSGTLSEEESSIYNDMITK